MTLKRYPAISETNPSLAHELADRALATVITRGSGIKVEWECRSGHIYLASPANRVNGRGCPFCAAGQHLSRIASSDIQLANRILHQMRTGVCIESEDGSKKYCTRCGELKSLDQFYLAKKSRDGHKAYCSDCGREDSREWIIAHPEENRARARKGYEDDPEAGKKRAKEWSAKNPEKRRAICRKWSQENPELQRASTQRRRARLANVEHEKFRDVDVFERDKWICGICGQPINPAERHPAPGHAQLDHVVPIAKGGPHTWENVQASHAICNQQKSAG